MNRKQFIRNLVGATAAVIIGKKLSVLAQVPGIGGQQFKVKLDDNWMQQKEVEFMQKWMHDQEMAMWYGTV